MVHARQCLNQNYSPMITRIIYERIIPFGACLFPLNFVIESSYDAMKAFDLELSNLITRTFTFEHFRDTRQMQMLPHFLKDFKWKICSYAF